MTHVIVDADSLVYQAAASVESTLYSILPLKEGVEEKDAIDAYGDSLEASTIITFERVTEYRSWLLEMGKVKEDFYRLSTPTVGTYEDARCMLDAKMAITRNATNPTTMTVLVGGEDNFRFKVAKLRPYKESRQGIRKPHHHSALLAYIKDRHSAVTVNGCEADDMCGILGTSCMASGEPFVIAGIDKDLLSIPGSHYNYSTKVSRTVTQQQADRWFWTQVLTGDSTDCIPGLHGVGEARAGKLLGEAVTYDELKEKVIHAYTNAFSKDRQNLQGSKYAGYSCAQELLEEQARLIYMQRNVNEKWNLDGNHTTYTEGDSNV